MLPQAGAQAQPKRLIAFFHATLNIAKKV